MRGNRQLKFFCSLILLTVGIFWVIPVSAKLPPLANYYLNPLPTDNVSLQKLAQNDVLILSADQIITRNTTVNLLKKLNPDIIILAYFPSQSYNTKYWGNDVVFKNLRIQDTWWLKDAQGNIISTWSGIRNLNMHYDWSNYYVQFINNYLSARPEVDGIFFDMISENISWAGKDLDMNGDGRAETTKEADSIWLDRTAYFLQYASLNLKTDYIIINGSSKNVLQSYVNGRMFETFPTAWEGDGRWSTLMNNLVKIKTQNKNPQLYVFNSNTRNTGDLNNYREMRFGLTSSLLEDDVYFSFDYGVANHGQIWNYDEYMVDLGNPLEDSTSLTSDNNYNDSKVWQRNYANGLVLVNPTTQPQLVNLGGEYEKITGTQDTKVNDGRIVNKVTIGSRDGLLMLKTLATVRNLVFTNGYFLHFLTLAGERVRNGFFAFEDGAEGGTKIYRGDLDGNSRDDKIVTIGPRLEIINSDGQFWYQGYPLGANLKGDINTAVGTLEDKNKDNLLMSGSNTGEVILLSYYGGIIKDKFYPLGEKYKGGFYVAMGDVNGDGKGEIILGTGKNTPTKIIIYDSKLKKKIKEFFPYEKTFKGGVSVAVGDVNGDGKDEIITLSLLSTKTNVRIFDYQGKKISEFNFGSSFLGSANFVIGTVDVDYNGKDDIVIMSK